MLLQISKALLDEQQRLRVPQFLRDRTPRPVRQRHSHFSTVAIIDGTVTSLPMAPERDSLALDAYLQENPSNTERR